MPTATITSKGQITIPKAVREQLELRPGDRVDFVMENEESVLLRKASLSIEKLQGVLYRPGMRRVAVAEMKRAVLARFKERS